MKNLLLVILLLFPTVVKAQSICALTPVILSTMKTQNWKLAGQGLLGTDYIYQLYVKKDTTFLIVRLGKDGYSCVLTIGDGWTWEKRGDEL